MSTETKIEEMNYEEALKELEELIRLLESEELALEKALGYYERGQALSIRCAQLLNQAELKIQQISENGELRDFE